ncbi:MAG: NUDIX hydrolase [Nitrospiraceae bacterium]|nr:NUDIX hydrolase [Nitrospiraceae bacterium]MDA8262033.1 NUDIX hydrolase [Actinomycetota bacterium]
MTVRAAGAVVVRDSGSTPLVCVVHRPRYDDWSLPKGKIDKGESEEDAARREVLEEAGVSGLLVANRRTSTSYIDNRGRDKSVTYFLMKYTSGRFTPNDEVDDIAWLPPDEAAARLTYKHDELVVRQLLDDSQGITEA